MKYHVLIFCAAVSMTACDTKSHSDSTEIAQDENKDKFKKTSLGDDSEFAVKIAEGGMMEVKLGELALTNASSPKVKAFAQSMITDHTKAGNELKALAQTKSITVPTSLSNDHQKKYDDFTTKKGADFDKAYTELMVKDHKEVVDLLNKEIDKGGDVELKAWATKTLPTIEHHLMMAQEMDKSVSYK